MNRPLTSQQQRENPRFGGAHSFVSIRLRRLAGREKGTGFKERVCLPEPGSAKPVHLDGKNRLENNVETSGPASLSDLQPPTRFLYSPQRSAPDAVVQRAMRHTSPETKLHYQLGMADQVRNAADKANKRLYGKRVALHFRGSQAAKSEEVKIAVCN
ncbi:MAG: hypothetical protein WAU89_25035 [Candidatus Acidiferrales bacterium]